MSQQSRWWIELVCLCLLAPMACSSPKGNPSECAGECAGAQSHGGASGAAPVGASAGAGSAGAAAGGSPSHEEGYGDHPLPTTPDCVVLGQCCPTLMSGALKSACYSFASTNDPTDCVALLDNAHEANTCLDLGTIHPVTPPEADAGDVGSTDPPPIFGAGFSTRACTEGDECDALIGGGSGSGCQGVASVSCPFANVSGCCIISNAEFCIYNATSEALSSAQQKCAGLFGSRWSTRP